MVRRLTCVMALLLPAAAGVTAGGDGNERYFLGDDVKQTAARFEERLDVNPFDPVALNNLAVARAEQGEVYEAEELLRRAVKIAPEDPTLRQNLERVQRWQPVQSSDFAPPTRYQLPEGFDRQGLPPTPPPLWRSRETSRRGDSP